MKKILTILAASAMFFAFGEDINNGAGFEDYTSTGEGSFDPGAYEPGSNVYYWYSASSAGNVISNHVAAPALPSGVTVPDYFKDDNTNTNFLYLETEAPLFRTVKTNSHDPATFEGVSITENPIYLDTLVKFTAADSAFTQLEDDADKIAIEYVEHEEESHEDQTTGQTVIDSAGFTNFVVRAGYVDGNDSQTNYFVAVPAGFNKDAWHRLTVRSIANVGDGSIGFVIYLDQELLKYGTDVEAGNSAYTGVLNADVKAKFYSPEAGHALFPSAVRSGDDKATISAVAFSGNGSVDDVVFTTTKPNFIQESSLVTVTWTNTVTALTLNGVAVNDLSAGRTDVTPTNGVVSIDSIEFAPGYEMGACNVTGAAGGGWNGVNAFTNLASGATCNIVPMFPYFEVDGQKFDKFADALAVAKGETAAQRGTVKVYASYTGDIEVKTGFVTIDLAGQTLTGKTDAAIINDGADLIITNSTVTIGHIETGNASQAILLSSGSTTITAGWVDGEAFIDGGALTLTGGYYYDINESTDVADFYLLLGGEATIADTVSYVGDPAYYFQVGESGGGDTPTEIAVPTAVTGLAYNGTVQTGVVEAVGFTLTGNTGTNAGGYQATATLASGYAWVGGSTEPTNIYWSITYKQITPTIVLDPASATLDANKTTVGDYTTVKVYDGETQLTLGTDYVVNYLDTAVSKAGEYTIEVAPVAPIGNYKVNATTATLTITASGGYPSYIDTTDDTIKGKYDAWAQTYGADTGSAYEAAFLLNVDPDTGDTTLDATNIVISGTTVTITIDHEGVNGYPYVLQAATLDGLKTATPTPATIGAGGVITLTSSAAAQFFKVGVSATPIAVP